MGEDVSKNIKIKLSLNNLAVKPTGTPASNNKKPEDNKAISDLKLKPPSEPIKTLPSDQDAKSVQGNIEEKPKISIKKPQLQDMKLKINLATEQKPSPSPTAEEPPKNPAFVPAYARNNVPDQKESDANSPSLKILEDLKGKTQKIVEPETNKKPIIDLNALNIDLEKDNSKSEPAENTTPPASDKASLPEIDFETTVTARRKNLSDTVKLKVKPQPGTGEKVFANIIKDTAQEPPPLMPKHEETKDQDDFIIPKNVLPHPSAGREIMPRNRTNWIVIGILAVFLIAIVYFMITSIRTLAS